MLWTAGPRYLVPHYSSYKHNKNCMFLTVMNFRSFRDIFTHNKNYVGIFKKKSIVINILFYNKKHTITDMVTFSLNLFNFCQ